MSGTSPHPGRLAPSPPGSSLNRAGPSCRFDRRCSASICIISRTMTATAARAIPINARACSSFRPGGPVHSAPPAAWCRAAGETGRIKVLAPRVGDDAIRDAARYRSPRCRDGGAQQQVIGALKQAPIADSGHLPLIGSGPSLVPGRGWGSPLGSSPPGRAAPKRRLPLCPSPRDARAATTRVVNAMRATLATMTHVSGTGPTACCRSSKLPHHRPDTQ